MRLFLSAILFILATMTLCFALAVSPPAAVFGQGGVVLGPAPVSLMMDLGATVPVELRVRDVQDLSSFEIDLAYDPSVVTLERVERLVGAPGFPTVRSWVSLPATNDPAVTFTQLEPGLVTFGAYSFGVDNPPGVSGDVPLARLHLRGKALGESPLRIDRVILADSAAQVISPTLQAGVVTVTPAYERPSRLFLPLLSMRATFATTE